MGLGDMTLSPQTDGSTLDMTNEHAHPSSAKQGGTAKSHADSPIFNVSRPETAVATVGPGHTVATSSDDASSALWKQAYDELRKDNPSLMEEYEMVLKEQAGVPQDGTMQNQMHTISKAQQLKCKNKQWSFQWFGQPQSVRDTIERILNLTSRSASLISIGMTYAPPYVSVPWSAVTALIPLMMNDFKEHTGCIAGLEVVARLTFSYQMAEQTFLGSTDTRDRYRSSVMDLYKKILEYEALAIQYFGRSTLHRLGKNAAGSTRWANMPTELSDIDKETRRSIIFLGQLTLTQVLERQEKAISSLIQSAAAKKDEVTQVTKWVSAISVELDHRDVRAKLGAQHHSSGGWFLDDPRVRAWKEWNWNESSQCLWLRGGVGTGKSSLASILIQDTINSADSIVAFFYCSKKADKINENSTARNDHENALRSLLSQASVSVDGSAVDKGVLKRSALDPRGFLAGVGLTAEDCVQMLDDIFSTGQDQKFTVVIDALDECLDYDSLLDALQSAASTNKNVRVFFSSRLQVKVQDYFEENVCVDVGDNNIEDIKRFLNIEIPRRRPGSGMTDSQAQRLTDTLVAKASGMFMWVKLQVNLFLNEIKSKRIRLEVDIEPKLLSLESSEAIGEELLYTTYMQVYEAAIGCQEDRRKEIVTTALRWVLCAFRTLNLRELAYATSVRPDGTVADGIQEGLVMDFCSNFLVEDAVGNVRLAHLSVRHYLERRTPPDFDAELAHLQAALTCLYFANSPKYHEIGASSADTFQDGNVVLTKTFHKYVQANWTRHCREAKKSTEMSALMDKFALKLTSQEKATSPSEPDGSPNSHTDYTAGDVTGGPASQSDVSRSWIDLLWRTDSGAVDFIEQFIARGGDLAVRNGFGNTLLHEAVRFRVAEVMSLLLNAGAPVNARDGLGNTPLHLAALHRFDQGAQLLLQARADKNARNSKGETPLHVAISLAVQDVIDTLLAANADGVARDHFGETPIHRAAAAGNSIATESLLVMGFSPNGKNQSGSTPLSLAIKLRHPKVAKVLVKHGALVTDDDLAALRRLGLVEVAEFHVQKQHGHGNLMSPEQGLQENKYTYVVTFPNGSHACDCCNISRWLTGSRRGTSYRHHSSLQQLFASAENGCPLCVVFRRQLPDAEDIRKPGYASGQLTVTLEPSYTQGSRQDRKDKLMLSAGSTQLLTLELSLSESCYSYLPSGIGHDSNVMPELDWLRGRSVEEQPLTSSSLSTVMGWINTCRDEHPVCWRDDLCNSSLPTRVLDVDTGEDNIVRLHTSSSDERWQFVYLSFFWGNARPAVCALRENIQSLMAGIPVDSMSEVHREAINATRRLGLRYLWIDALCIIQDSPQDWATESQRMSEYISNAAFVLQAAASPNANARLYQPRPQPLLHMEVTRGRGDIASVTEPNITTGVDLRLPLQTASEALGVRVLKRGWMFQEIILPRRMLIFGADQIYWHCQAGLMSEGDTLIHEPMLKLLPLSSASSDFDRRDRLLSWYQLLSDYSASILTFKSDRIIAMRSLAKYFDADDALLAGLWKRDLRNGLLWRVDNIRKPGIVDRPAARTDKVSASWSWASIDGRVQYDFLRGARQDFAARHSIITDIYIDYKFTDGDYNDQLADRFVKHK
ncbi:hypothetical protein N8I77_013525 [Diaporthe amygdali]|uniref:Uncharacterized protein n=1 Tax=Phomopsis amygdali TaxID=1214568 RepID=A0AAD9S1W1_PHOAM|nr:hypothetical protein N8I77_013525 [Diaporthe amygdali]